MKRLLKEPLLHFALLGAAFFAIDAQLGERTTWAGADTIVVSQGRIENLAALFSKTWQRPPTAAELRGLVDDFIIEEALYREGQVLGVDQDDTIIRRRVRQKMEFMVDDIIELVEPTDDDLEQWLAEHPADHARPASYRFRQLYLSAERHGVNLQTDALQVLAQLLALEENADPRGLGDPSLFEHAFADVSVQVVVSTFGEEFAEGLVALTVGEWSGPVESTFGLHLVYVDARTEGRPPPLDEVRAEVERDWSFAQREEASKRFNEGILARYHVVVEWPVDADDSNEEQKP